MPRNVLPEAARVLPKAGQKIWLSAFNGALDEGLPEDEASKMAWAAVKRAGYTKQSNGKWGKMLDSDIEVHDDGSFVFSAPLMKIDVEKRIVGGFATLNNIDEAKDIVESDASVEAFSQWFGNIREMHDKKAVGKAVDWVAKTHTDDEGNTYEGIWVEAKISKGAEDTWQKVLDGTLSGFSIGGATLEKQRDIVKDESGAAHQVWRITKYKLTELSLVDSPCNRLATISLIKSVDGNPEVGDTIADEDTDSVEKAYNGATGEFVDLSGDYQGVVTALETLRDQAIRNNADSVVARVSELLDSLRRTARWEKEEAEYANNVTKNEDADTIIKEEIQVTETTETLQENENPDNTNVGILSEDEKSVFRKFIDFVKNSETPTTELEKSDEGGTNIEEEGETPEMKTEEVQKAIDEAVSGVSGELSKSVDDKFEQVGESLTKLAEALEKVATAEAVETVKTELTAQFEELAGRVEALETSGAVKKSGDDAADEAGEKMEKSEEGFWAGSLLPDFLVK